MFELEIRNKVISQNQLSPEVKVLFRDFDAEITALSILPWEEHCTECAMPECFKTCDLYQPRSDGKCRRFIGGIGIIHKAPNIQNSIARVSFKRWGQLMAYVHLHMTPLARAKFLERNIERIDRFIAWLPDDLISIRGRQGLSSRMMRRLKQKIAKSGLFAKSNISPDYLLIEVLNPNEKTIQLSLSLQAPPGEKQTLPFQKLLQIPPGFHREKIPFHEIQKVIDTTKEFHISLNPNILHREDEGLTLYFGTLGFVQDKKYTSPKEIKKPVKLVIWDLDNTLWEGILVEDGSENISLIPEARQMLEALDKKGILNSIASKNNEQEALSELEKFGLSQYFLFPQINWNPKGANIAHIIQDFNIGADTVAFIDDSPFERDQVQSMNPEVRCYDSADIASLLPLEEFNPPSSKDAPKRREYYKNESARKEELLSFTGEYFEFLKQCNIKLLIQPADESNLDRIQELVQRTNQMNFSGNRYSREEIQALVRGKDYDLFMTNCEDNFGQYGTVGFAVVQKAGTQLIDLMFSCRVQAKRVEHAFLSFLLEYYKSRGAENFQAHYQMTERNKPAGAVFSDLAFNTIEQKDDFFRYSFPLQNKIPNDKIITCYWKEDLWAFEHK